MTDLRYITIDRVAEQVAPEPSIPESHESVELGDGTVVYNRGDPQQWIWANEAVDCTDAR